MGIVNIVSIVVWIIVLILAVKFARVSGEKMPYWKIALIVITAMILGLAPFLWIIYNANQNFPRALY